MWNKLIVLFFVSLLFLSCGNLEKTFNRQKTPVTTKIHFSVKKDGISTMAQMLGGIMIYITGENGNPLHQAGFSLTDETDPKIIELPNGSYRFFAVGFSGANTLSGQAKCGYGNGGDIVNLLGTDKVISLVLNTANCNFGANSIFSKNAFSIASNFNNNLTIDFCDSSDTVNFLSTASLCTATTSVAASGNTSAIIVLNGYKKTDAGIEILPGEGLRSACLTPFNSVPPAATQTATLTIPVGNALSGFAPIMVTSIAVFLGDISCATTPHSILFPNGLNIAVSSASTKNVYSSSGGTTVVKIIDSIL